MQRTILIVDDLAMNRDILSEMLCDDYQIIQAENGTEALDILDREHQNISVVLLDIVMPVMDGYEVLRRIRADAVLTLMPVIMITGSEDEESRIRALALGANDFIIKPYNPAIIIHCLNNNIALREASSAVSTLQRDQLTGLYNREVFFAKARELIMSNEPGFYIMACYDIGNFKVINDQYGTQQGDAVLQHIGTTFKNGFSAIGGICSRVAADDFVVLYPSEFADSKELKEIRYQAAKIDGLTDSLVFLVGRYRVDDLSLSPSAMYDRALLAAASVRERFDTNIGIYDESMRARLIQRQEIVTEMKGALKARQFEVWYQPQYNHSSGALIGAEALVRWRHPKNGLIPPNSFIPIFEENGFIYSLDKFVWEEVCRVMRGWINDGRNPLPVSVNISRYDVLRPDVVTVIRELVDKYGIPVDLLRLEITESAFSESTQKIVNVVTELISYGFTVEIDDFGSGYSSLNTLKDVPAQILKLDMRFLEGNSNTQRGGNIVESIVRMAKWLGMAVIAEGVETIEQADYLRSVGCNYIQGYLFARPMPQKDYEALCAGAGKEEQLLKLETVENLDNNSFWDPASMDTLIFNSFIGGACIYEYHKGRIELLRANEKYVQVIGSAGMTVEDALRLNWVDHLDAETARRVLSDLSESVTTKNEITGEYLFLDLPGCPHETYLRSSMRVIASADERYLVYCTNENITAQRQAEKSATKLSEQMHAIMRNVDLGICASIKRGSITEYLFANDKYYELFGYTREQYLAEVTDDTQCVVSRFRSVVMSNVRNVLQGAKPVEMIFEIIRRDGSIRIVRDSISSGYFNGMEEPVLLSILRDVTDEMQSELDLLDNLPTGSALYEYDGKALTAVHLNRRYWELVNRAPVEYAKATFLSAVHPEDRFMIFRELADAIRQQRDFAADFRVRYGESDYRPFHVAANIVKKGDRKYSIYASYLPISDDVMSFQKMLPHVLSAVMNSTADYTFVKDADYRYVCSSKAYANYVGFSDENEVVGKTDYDLFDKTIAEQFRMDDETIMKDGVPIIEKVETMPSVAGVPHYASTSKYPLFDEAGKKIGLLGLSRDITESRDATIQLRLITESLPGGLATIEYCKNTFKLLYYNEGYCQILSSTRKQFEKDGPVELRNIVSAEDWAELVRQIKELIATGKPVEYIYSINHKDCGTKWIEHRAIINDQHDDVYIINNLILDVTESYTMTERLRLAQEEYRMALMHSACVICRFKVAEKTASLLPEVAEILGVPETVHDFPYAPVREGKIEADSVDVFIGMYEDIINGSKSGSAIYQEKFAGEWKWMKASYSTIFTADGEPDSAIVSFFDVTDQQKKEIVYRRWQQSLQERDPRSYTLFCCNLSKDSSYDTREGELLNFVVDQNKESFNERTEEYLEQCVFHEDRERYRAFLNTDTMLASYYRGKRAETIDYRESLADGEVRWLRLSVELVEYPNSSDVEAYLMYEDINEIKLEELATLDRADNDPLTGVMNRSSFAKKVDKTIADSKLNTRFALFLIDIDGFKMVNDVFGHAAGDQALIDIAELLRDNLRRSDLLGRLGGDEFLIFIDDVKEDADVANKARQVCTLIRKSFSLEVHISASLGIAIVPRDGMTFEELYKKADIAMYQAKDSGKDAYDFYRNGMEFALPNEEDETAVVSNLLTVKSGKKRRMLIVEDNRIDSEFLAELFKDDFIVEQAYDGNSALISLRHYGSAISVVLLALNLQGMKGVTVLEKMRASADLQLIPVVIVTSSDDRETYLEIIRRGATDYITKPVDPELLTLRVQSAVSKAENERLRAKNSYLELQSTEKERFETLLEDTGGAVIEYDWHSGVFVYFPSVSKYIAGVYDGRKFWSILLSDMVTDTATVQRMQHLVYTLANDHAQTSGSILVVLETPERLEHHFRMNVRKLTNEFKLTNKLIISLIDLDL